MPQTTNPASLDIINQLETALNKKIPELKKDSKIDWNTVGYTTDLDGNINSLGLYNCKVKIEHLERIKNLTSLTSLDLSSNKIQDATLIKDLILKQRVAGGPGLKVTSNIFPSNGEVSLGNNPLTTPPMEVVAQGTEAFLRWFEVKKVKLNIIKINLMGNTTAGKTSLIKCLNFDDKTEEEVLETVEKNFNPPEDSTHGMQIWKKKNGGLETKYYRLWRTRVFSWDI